MKALMIAAIAPIALMACQTGTPPPSTPERAPDTCGAAGYDHLIGTQHDARDFAAPGRVLRIIPPNSAVTMDYNTERLNVDIDDRGRVTRIWCG